MVSIGAVKPKTKSDFGSHKADIGELQEKYEWELGYFYTAPEQSGKGFSTTMVRLLMTELVGISLMASTELKEENSMKRILERAGFVRRGKSWNSEIHGGELGLFLTPQKAVGCDL